MFPEFNIHSTPLLLLIIQGLLFAFLLLFRFIKNKRIPYLLISILLFSIAYEGVSYLIGFMGWYDTFINSKTNYFLMSTGLISGPLIYLYIRTLLNEPFTLRKQDIWHFIPIISHMIYRLVILIYDSSQEGWLDGYEGELFQSVHANYMSIIIRLLEYSALLLYLAFTVQLFYQHKLRIKQHFSNTYQLELKWIQLFLTVFTVLFLYHTITDLADAIIEEISYIHNWWYRFFEAGIMVFLGIKAYFTNLENLLSLKFEFANHTFDNTESHKDYDNQMKMLNAFMEHDKAFLKADFTLSQLSRETGLNVHEVSEVINAGFGVNFNEWINRFRVDEVRKKLKDPSNNHLSILAIAYDCGFNSKATFNRIFKQLTGESPSEFKKKQQN